MLSYVIEKNIEQVKKIYERYPNFGNLLIGNKKFNKQETQNLKQISFMAVTGLAFTCMITAQGKGVANIIGRISLGVLTTIGFTVATYLAMTANHGNAGNKFAVVSKKGDFSHAQTFYLFTMLCGINYMSTRGFEYMISFILSSKLAKIMGFVMANLVSIYPSKDLRNDQLNADVFTISGLMGVIAFTICAAAIHLTNSYSSSKAMFALKAIPIFLACTEAIYAEKYGKDLGKDRKSNGKSDGRIITSVLGSIILTGGGYLGGDYLTNTICSSSTNSIVKFVAEVALTPVILISASLSCGALCNPIGRYFDTVKI